MSNIRKIAFVGNSALTMMNFRLGVMKALSSQYEVVMMTPQDCELTQLSGTNIRFVPIHVDCKGQNPIKDIRFLSQLKQIYAQEGFDFVFHYTIKPIIYGSLAASQLGIKHINVITGLGYTFIKRNWLFYLSCQMHRYALRSTNAVWFLNQDDCDAFVKWHIIPFAKTHVIHGEGVNTDFYRSTREPEKPFIFLYCGRMLRSKGVELYIRAAEILKAEFPDARWQLLGPLDALNPDAIRLEEMEAWVRKGAIEYLGVTSDVRPFLERCSCMVLPSYYMEGVPRSLMEAASMERTLIATDSVGCKEVVLDGENGLLCEKRNLNSLVEAMRKILNAPSDKLRCMGQKGRELMLRKFDERIIIEEYKNALNTYA